MCKWILSTPLTLMMNDGGFGKEMEDSIKNTTTNLKNNSAVRLTNVPKSLEYGDVGLKFQLKRLEFIHLMS